MRFLKKIACDPLQEPSAETTGGVSPRATPSAPPHGAGKTAFSLGLLGLLSATLFTGVASPQRDASPAREIHAVTHSAIDPQSQLRIEARPVMKELRLTGVLAPDEEHTVTAPFDAVVLEKQVSLGQRVSAGDVLARVGTRDIEMQLREADAALIKAQQRLRNLEDWANSPQVSRAKRDLDLSRRRLETLRQRAAQSRKLLDIGIIPASEYKSELQALADQRADVASAREALDSTLKQGDATAVKIATLEQKNAEIKANLLRDTIAAAVITAPIDGIVVAARSSDVKTNHGDLGFHVGDRIEEGLALLSVAHVERLIVRSSISEIDINSVAVGQPATIVSDSLPGVTMTGHLTRIAYQAKTGSLRDNRFPHFDVELALDDVPAEQHVRLGVTVEVAMDIYHNNSAIVVPFAAIQSGAGGPYARVATRGGASERRPVQLGVSFVDGVEVISGLQEGDVVAVAATTKARDDQE